MITPTDFWNTVIAFPVVPFRGNTPDYSGFRKNVDYLLANNWLDQNRPRVLGFGGGSLIHHLQPEEQLRLVEEMCAAGGDQAAVMAGIIPTPTGQANQILASQAKLSHPPDAHLLIPVVGITNPQGIFETLFDFCEENGRSLGTRFFLYLRNRLQLEAMARLVRECEYVLGVKVGTELADVRTLVKLIGNYGIVMWGIGDCAVSGIKQGAIGHTAGSATLFVQASDKMNNAYRQGDWEKARSIEQELTAFEDLRFVKDRAYNYSTLVAAAKLGGFSDIDCGEGAPFNAMPPRHIIDQIRIQVEKLKLYH